MQNYIIEFIGTFFLVLVIALTGDPLAIGIILTAMVYMGGPISGAHYNPAVTLAVLVRKKINLSNALAYMLSQIIGATMAAFMYFVIKKETFAPAPDDSLNVIYPLLVEIVFTFALASVVLNVATSKKTAGNSYFGIAIGFTILASAFAGGAISGGAFNPAVGVGPAIIEVINGKEDSLTHLWIYLVGPFGGGLLGAIVYKLTNQDEF